MREGLWVSVAISGLSLSIGLLVCLLLRDRARRAKREEEREEQLLRMLHDALEQDPDTDESENKS